MSDNQRLYVFEQLREKFVSFMLELNKMPGSPQQKQQAFIRFDEGHMWMQNAVLSFKAPELNAQPSEFIATPTEAVNQVIEPTDLAELHVE